ncbi:MAG: hypothetical protein PWR01_4731, partial [Clostridiales bacterium]|nr:hypothetical protein [Clostridiales bacterium]MDN5283658.1 hypothetical protein [Candidatus Ozemobacter sp.]
MPIRHRIAADKRNSRLWQEWNELLNSNKASLRNYSLIRVRAADDGVFAGGGADAGDEGFEGVVQFGVYHE